MDKMSAAEQGIHGQIKKEVKRKTSIKKTVGRVLLASAVGAAAGAAVKFHVDTQSPSPVTTPSNQSALMENRELNKMTIEEIIKNGAEKHYLTYDGKNYLTVYGPKIVEVEYTPIITPTAHEYNRGGITVRSDATENSEISTVDKDKLSTYAIRVLGNHHSGQFGYIKARDLLNPSEKEGGLWFLVVNVVNKEAKPILNKGKPQLVAGSQVTVTNPNPNLASK